jgi:hypothetical protein
MEGLEIKDEASEEQDVDFSIIGIPFFTANSVKTFLLFDTTILHIHPT